MLTNARVSGMLACAILVVVGAILFRHYQPGDQTSTDDTTPIAAESSLLVRDDSHYLSQSNDGKVTIVEFLDFECEACLAMFPIIERLREEYGDQITFVVRYFPLDGHPNSVTAATAVEAAAQQGAFEQMYKRMFQTQTVWGHNEASQKPMFLAFADDLGLDRSMFEITMDSPETLARVQRDFDDGIELGVRGTPTFFINGVQTEPMPSYDVLVELIEAELAGNSSTLATVDANSIISRRDE